jgi:hypothetical protein
MRSETSFQLDGDLILVDAVVRGFSIKPTVTRTAAAGERGYLVQLLELSTRGVTAPAVHVNVAELGYGIDGVLGMNF